MENHEIELLTFDFSESIFMKIKIIATFTALLFGLAGYSCTNILVTKGASADSSTFLVYTNDGEWLYHLDVSPAKDFREGDSIVYFSMSGKRFAIPQVQHTYALIGFQMNEFQLSIGETTFLGREELWDKNQPLKYWELMRLGLERARTAREAIEVMTTLAEKYGYGSEGETFSIADPNEAWLLEMIGTGGKGGAIWIARRVPDGYMTAHANHARIGEILKNDPENCLYSENIFSFAVENEFYNPSSGKPFRFNDAYDPPSADHLKYSESRVWSVFRRAAPSGNFSSDYHRGVAGAEPYPLFIKPDKKLNLENIFALVRDHYEGTPFDMTSGPAAGGFGNPNRPRPLYWEIDSIQYSWERPISTYNTAFSFVAQMRNYLPDEVGGVVWFGVDDTYTTCYFPIYCQSVSIPVSFQTGDINQYSSESAWWVFNFVANLANVRYNDMVADIQKVQQKTELQFIQQQYAVESAALLLDKPGRILFLSNYTVMAGDKVHQEWKQLGNYLLTKYNDGYIKNPQGKIQEISYPDNWLETIIELEPNKYQVGGKRKSNY
ncbi:MAG TPA: C69 family dipeptidase [Bacteroidales bacterium]